jgi:hypothetical protein
MRIPEPSKIIPVLLALGLLLGLHPDLRAGNPEYERKLKEIQPGDHEAIFKLALWCVGMDEELKRRGRDHFEDLVFQAGEPWASKAKYRLGLFALTRGKLFTDLKRAGRYLKEAAEAGNEAATRRLEELRQAHDENKSRLVEKANGFLAKRRFDLAVKILDDAYRLPLGDGSLSDRSLLERLAHAYREMGKELSRLDLKEVVPTCSTCGGTGYMECKKCKGTGKVKGKTPDELVTGVDGSKYKKGGEVEMKCPYCKATGGKICSGCAGLGLNMALLPAALGKNLRSMATSLKRLEKRKDPWDAIRKTWEKVVALRLHIPAGFKVEGVKGDDGLVPPDDSRVDRKSLEKMWEGFSEVDKHKFLLSFSVRAASYLRSVFLHDSGRKSLAEKAPYDLATSRIPFDVAPVAAFPEIFHDRWIAVRGKLLRKRSRRGKNEVVWEDDSLKRLDLKGPGHTNLCCIYWTAEGREKHTLLAKLKAGRQFDYLEKFVWAYKYPDVSEKVEEIKRDSEVILFGRFIHNPLGTEPALLEIWDLDLVKEEKSRSVTVFPGPAVRLPLNEATVPPGKLAGYYLSRGLGTLRDEVFNKARRRRRGDEAREAEERRAELRAAALKDFRRSRDLLEGATQELESADRFTTEKLEQVHREILRILGTRE